MRKNIKIPFEKRIIIDLFMLLIEETKLSGTEADKNLNFITIKILPFEIKFKLLLRISNYLPISM
jgi:hypothetical protein